MANLEAQFAFAIVLAIVLSMFGAWLIGYRYRVAVRRLMSATLEAPVDAAPSATGAARAAAPPQRSAGATAAGNRWAAWRLTLVLAGLSLLMSVSVSSIVHTLMFGSDAFSYKRTAVLAVVQAWPVVPVIGLVWRWSRLRIVGVLAAWFAVSFGIALWRSITPDAAGVLAYVALEIGPPMLLIAALYFGDATRAIAPWLFPLVLGFVVASLAGSNVLAYLVERHTGWMLPIVGALGATATFALALVLPWIVAWWPLRAAGRALARAYARKHLSELGVLLAAVWGIALLYEWSRFAQEGPVGAVVLLPLGWIVAAAWIGARLARRAPPAPTLLVLRVFQRDAQVQGLFDTVIERWRVSGNTVLIAGTDLIDRTLDADDIFAFLDGRLAGRFIRSAADVEARIAAFDLRPDHDGRYRVNECYCHDTTWQRALAALVERSDVVLMDLRGYQAHNAGCAHELGVLARARHIARVVVLVDAGTDRAAAAAASAGAPEGRFAWVETPRIDRRGAHAVLRRLFAPAPAPVP